MKALLVALALLVAACVPSSPPHHYAFHDEFTARGLNHAVWGDNWLGRDGTVTKPPNDSMRNCQSPDEVVQPGDGYLHLKLEHRFCGNWPYAAGLVNTDKSFHFTEGTIEARMYLPGTNGVISNWPGLWTNGQHWPYDGENDVMEGLSGHACATYHSSAGSSGSHCPAGDFTGWHVFRADVHDGGVTWFYDGHKIGRAHATRSPQFVILQEATGGYGGPIVAPSEVLIDYVRVSA